MKKRKFFWLILSFLLSFSLFLPAQERKNPFLLEWNDAIQPVKPGQIFTLRVSFRVPPGHYLYADKIEAKFTQTGELQEIKREIPKPEKHYDHFLKAETKVYFHDFEMKILFKVPAKAHLGRMTLEGEVRYQGCSSDFCYRPMKATVLVPLDITNSTAESQERAISMASSAPSSIEKISSTPFFPKPTHSFWYLLKEGQVDEILKAKFTLILALAFMGGLLTCFTPCVLPIIPLTLAGVGIKKNRSWVHNLGLSFSLVMGMSLTYALLGLVSAFFGFKLGFLFQSQIFLVFLVLFFTAMSLSLFDFFQIELPLKFRNFFAGLGGRGPWGAMLAGLSIGFVASPCVGPLIAPLLLWVAKNQSVGKGGLILFTYGLGMGSLFILGGTFYSTFAGKLRGGSYSNVLKQILAFSMLLPALYYGYVIYQQYQTPPENGWVYSLKDGLKKAQSLNKPVIIDFYADWCLPCIEIDNKTFHHAKVEEVLKDFVPIKINCSLETPSCKAAVSQYEVLGWPTLFFLDSKLELQRDLSVVGGFVGPERMLEILSELKKRSSP